MSLAINVNKIRSTKNVMVYIVYPLFSDRNLTLRQIAAVKITVQMCSAM